MLEVEYFGAVSELVWEMSYGSVRRKLEGPFQYCPRSCCRDLKERDHHYALVCHSHVPLALSSHGAFDPAHCVTVSGKRPAPIATTSLLSGDLYKDHSPGVYHFGFRATLVEPWAVRLVNPRKVASTDTGLFETWKNSWAEFVGRARFGTPSAVGPNT